MLIGAKFTAPAGEEQETATEERTLKIFHNIHLISRTDAMPKPHHTRRNGHGPHQTTKFIKDTAE